MWVFRDDVRENSNRQTPREIDSICVFFAISHNRPYLLTDNGIENAHDNRWPESIQVVTWLVMVIRITC